MDYGKIIEEARKRAEEAESTTSLPQVDLRKFIDYTLLKPEATRSDIEKLVETAIKRKYYSVCVNPHYASLIKDRTRSTEIATCAVVGFPLGATLKKVKMYETELLLHAGIDEIDMVMNIGAFKSGEYSFVEEELRAVASIHPHVKVIIETALLTDEEKITATKIVVNSGAQFVKTSTGFSKGGATYFDVALLRIVAGNTIGVKAAGGIRTVEKALRMILAGADRIGTSTDLLAENE